MGWSSKCEQRTSHDYIGCDQHWTGDNLIKVDSSNQMDRTRNQWRFRTVQFQHISLSSFELVRLVVAKVLNRIQDYLGWLQPETSSNQIYNLNICMCICIYTYIGVHKNWWTKMQRFAGAVIFWLLHAVVTLIQGISGIPVWRVNKW